MIHDFEFSHIQPDPTKILSDKAVDKFWGGLRFGNAESALSRQDFNHRGADITFSSDLRRFDLLGQVKANVQIFKLLFGDI